MHGSIHRSALESAAEKFEEGSTVARQSVAQAAKVTRNFFGRRCLQIDLLDFLRVCFQCSLPGLIIPRNQFFSTRSGRRVGGCPKQGSVSERKESWSPLFPPRDRARIGALQSDVRQRGLRALTPPEARALNSRLQAQIGGG
jgi:hypothetical protein